jgi:hypothetical protein
MFNAIDTKSRPESVESTSHSPTLSLNNWPPSVLSQRVYLWCKLRYPEPPDKRVCGYRNFPDILTLFLICILVYTAVPFTDLTIRFVTSYPVPFSMAQFMHVRFISTCITWRLCMYLCMYVCMYVRVRMYVCMYVRTSMYVCLDVCMFVCMYVSMYVFV